MSSPTVNEHVLNSLLAGFLVSSLPVGEQLIPRQWLHRLHQIPQKCEGLGDEENPQCEEEERKRDLLLRNFLIGLLKPELPEIFTEPPAPGPLPESEDVIPLLAAPSTQWATNLQRAEVPENIVQPPSFKYSTPSEFMSLQPTPCNGAFCYGAVFSQLAPKLSFSKD